MGVVHLCEDLARAETPGGGTPAEPGFGGGDGEDDITLPAAICHHANACAGIAFEMETANLISVLQAGLLDPAAAAYARDMLARRLLPGYPPEKTEAGA